MAGTRIGRIRGQFDGLKVSWVSIGVFAAVICLVDGFWVTSLQGAVGAIERRQSPFGRWLRDSLLMLPVFVLSVLGAMLLARRLVDRRGRGKLVKVVATSLAIVVVTSVVSIGEAAASSVWDYHLQARHLASSSHAHQSNVAVDPGSLIPAPTTCDELCLARRETLHLHVRAVRLAAIVMAVTNLLLVAWLMAARSERLWQSRPPSPRRADVPATAVAGGELLLR